MKDETKAWWLAGATVVGVALYIVFWLAVIAGGAYVAVHFIAKYW